MKQEEELERLRQENTELKERVSRLEALVQDLQEQMAKDSHNSHHPPSSDRFIQRTRKPAEEGGWATGASETSFAAGRAS